MADNTVEVKIEGQATGAVAAVNEAAAAVKAGAASMNDSLAILKGGFERFQGLVIGMTALLAGGKMFKDSISAANNWNAEVGKLAKSMGTSTQQASVMAVALDHIGVSTDTVAQASMMMSRQLANNENAFKVLGVTTRDTHGAFLPINEVMTEANEKLKHIKNTTEQNVAGMQIYGRGWAEVKAILKLNKEAMAEADETAKRLHLIVGPEGVEQTKNYKASMRDMKLVSESLEIQMGNALLPTMTKVGTFMGEEGPTMGAAFAKVLETIAFVAQATWLTLKDMGDSLGALAAQANALAHGDIAAMKAIGAERDAQAAKNEAQFNKLKENLYKPPEPPKSSGQTSGGGSHLNFKEKKEKGTGSQSRVGEWKTELEAKKEASNDFFKEDLDGEKSFWLSKLALIKGNSKQEVAERRAVQHEIYTINKQQAEQARQLKDESISQTERLGQQEVTNERARIQTMKDMGQINEMQALQMLQEQKNKEYMIELQALKAKQQLYAEDVLARQKAEDQITLLMKQKEADQAQYAQQLGVAQKKQIEDMLSPVSSAIDKTVTGMIQGTSTMKQSMANIGQSIVAEFVRIAVQRGVMWAATEMGMTKASEVGAMARNSIQSSSSSTTAAAKVTEATTAVGANAANAASGAAASVAAIPVAGWAMAPGIFASVMAMVLGAKSTIPSASGGFDIPAGINPLTQLHEREMVLPAEHAETIRNLGNAAGGGVTNLHVHAVDAHSVQRLFANNAGALVKALQSQKRNNAF